MFYVNPGYVCYKLIFLRLFFFNWYLAAPRSTLGHYRGGSLTHPTLITCILHIRPEGHREPRSEVGSLSPAERLVLPKPKSPYIIFDLRCLVMLV